MTSFPLKIVTPDGLVFDGQAESLILRTVSGDMGILAGHIDCISPIASGTVLVGQEGLRRSGHCSGGFLSVSNGSATLIARSFVWDAP